MLKPLALDDTASLERFRALAIWTRLAKAALSGLAASNRAGIYQDPLAPGNGFLSNEQDIEFQKVMLRFAYRIVA